MLSRTPEALWLQVQFFRVLDFLSLPLIYDFYQTTLSLSHFPAVSARPKRIDIHHHFIRAHVTILGLNYHKWTCMSIFILQPLLFFRYCDVLRLSVLMGVC